MAASPFFVGDIRNCFARVLNADATNLVTVLTPGTSGSRLKSLNCSSDDTVIRVLQLWITAASVDYLLGEVTIPVGAGSDGTSTGAVTKPVRLLNPADFPFLQSNGVNFFLDLAAGSVLKAKVKTTVTSGKALHLVGEYGDI